MNTLNSEPVIYLSNDMNRRCYVSFTHKHRRYRFYNGKALGLDCNPNREKTYDDRKREVNRLLDGIQAALKAGQFSDGAFDQSPEDNPFKATAYSCIVRQRATFDKQGWSKPYLRDMERIANELIVYLTAANLAQSPLDAITHKVLSGFLDGYHSSSRYYMNKRRNLSALFARLIQDEDLPTNPVARTRPKKIKEVLNEAFTPEQLTGVLAHLKTNQPNLYLCALMIYGTFLRPHREIRLLKRGDFDATLDHITLAGSATKSGRIRRVPVPDYVKEVLFCRGVDKMAPDAFILTGTGKPLNADYFTTAWSRQKLLMIATGTILPAQTLYSFRHSGAIYSFTNRQDIRLLQGLMGHSTPDVTMKYLRSLGIIETSKEDMPRLPGM